MNKNKAFRKSWIDICRGLGIILVLYGHVLGSDQSRYLIYSFHMPLFFFLSGLVFSSRDTSSLKLFFTKNFKQILIPYYIFALITFCLWLLFIQPSAINNIPQEVWGIIYGNGIFPSLEFNSPLWFLPCLFITKTFYLFIVRVSTNTKYRYLMLIGFGLLGYLFSYYIPSFKLPYSIEVALTAVVFFGFGHLWKSHTYLKNVVKTNAISLAAVTILITCILAWVHFQLTGKQIDMRINQLNNILFFYSSAMSGIIALITISYLINKNYLIEYIGKRTLLLFIWHYPLYLIFTLLLENISIVHTTNLKLFLPSLYTIAAISIILGVQYVVSHFKQKQLS